MLLNIFYGLQLDWFPHNSLILSLKLVVVLSLGAALSGPCKLAYHFHSKKHFLTQTILKLALLPLVILPYKNTVFNLCLNAD